MFMRTPIGTWGIPVLAALTLFVLSAPVCGSTFRSEDNVHITNLHRIDDDFYALGKNILIDGTIGGDLVAAAHTIDIKGGIDASCNVVCFSLSHNGRVQGSMRSISNSFIMNGVVGQSLVAAASTMTIGQAAVIGRDAHLVGSNELTIEGTVKGNLQCAGNSVRITGIIHGDVTVSSAAVVVAPPAVIHGKLTYVSPKEDALDTLTGANLLGGVEWKIPEEPVEESSNTAATTATKISMILAAFLFGVIVVRLFRPYAEESFHQLRTRPVKALAAGLLGAILWVFCMVVLLIALIVTVAALALMDGGQMAVGSILLILATLAVPITLFAAVSGGIVLYIAWILSAFVGGCELLRLVTRKVTALGAWGLLLGLTLLVVVQLLLPFPLDVILLIAVLLFGIGGILLGIKHCPRRREDTGSPGQDASA
jgi:cytoskeletal protein CcmA (bactofilin family)